MAEFDWARTLVAGSIGVVCWPHRFGFAFRTDPDEIVFIILLKRLLIRLSKLSYQWMAPLS